jgi:hypothetical protein
MLVIGTPGVARPDTAKLALRVVGVTTRIRHTDGYLAFTHNGRQP